MTVRMLMQFAGVSLLGALVGYLVAAWQHAKDRRRHSLQVDHLRTTLRQRAAR